MSSPFSPDPNEPGASCDPAPPLPTDTTATSGSDTVEVVSPNDVKNDRRAVMLTWLAVVAVGGILLIRGYALTVLSFIATLGILVFVHEWGHYQFARWAGMQVNRFGIGFPPWIYTKRYNGIDYSIGALPIGGMVDIAGLGSEEEMVATVKGAELTALTTRHQVPHGQRQFQEASLGWRFWTLFAGPLMNFLFALAVFIGVFSFVGMPVQLPPTNQIEEVTSGESAASAGIQANDYLIGINDQRTADIKQLSKLIRTSGGKTITVVVQRGNDILKLPVNPVFKDDLPKLDGEGTERAPAIGIRFLAKYRYQKIGVVDGVKLGFANAIGTSAAILGMLGRAATFKLTSDEKKGVGGAVKIAQVAGESIKQGWQIWVLFVATLSVNLGLLNLLPIPALDGGRIMFLGYELVARRPIDPKKESLVHMVGMAMVLAFMLFINPRDLSPAVTNALSSLSKHLPKG